MTTKRVRILLAHIGATRVASFVERDAEILRSKYDLQVLAYRGRMDFARLVHSFLSADATISWFAWDHSYWAATLGTVARRPTILITGGFDVVGLSDIGYGSLLDPRSARRVRASLAKSTRVVAISRAIRDSVALLGRTDADLIPLGFDPNHFPLGSQKERLVLTVGGVTESNLARKGIKLFASLAQRMPDVRFAIVGEIEPRIWGSLPFSIPDNLTLTGRVDDSELMRWMHRAKVYAQLSAHEGFGSAVAEAMLCGCVPVVADRGALPEVVGEDGIIVPWGDLDATEAATRRAIDATEEACVACRERVIRLFPMKRRKDALLHLVDQLTGG